MQQLPVDGVQLAYRVDGPTDAPSLVFVNSLGANLRMWEPQVAALSANLRIIRYDTRGHGSSDAPPGPYTIERLGRDLLALLDHLAIERTHICGLSLGGLTTMWLGINHPQRVERVVLANTAARIGTTATWQARIDAVQRGGMAAVRDAVLARFFSESFRVQNPEIAQNLADGLVATNPTGYIAACAALRDTDLRGAVAAISAPTLIIAGAHDQATPPAQSDELHAAISNSEIVTLDAAHISNIEQPDAFTSHLARWLEM